MTAISSIAVLELIKEFLLKNHLTKTAETLQAEAEKLGTSSTKTEPTTLEALIQRACAQEANADSKSQTTLEPESRPNLANKLTSRLIAMGNRTRSSSDPPRKLNIRPRTSSLGEQNRRTRTKSLVPMPAPGPIKPTIVITPKISTTLPREFSVEKKNPSMSIKAPERTSYRISDSSESIDSDSEEEQQPNTNIYSGNSTTTLNPEFVPSENELSTSPESDRVESGYFTSDDDSEDDSSLVPPQPSQFGLDVHSKEADKSSTENLPFEVVQEKLDYSSVNVVANQKVPLEYFNLKIIYKTNRTGFEESREFPIRKHDYIAGRYEILEFLGSAAFSRAIKCQDHLTKQPVCMKIIKNNKDFFDQSLDEIKLLKYIQSKGDPDQYHVLKMFDYFYWKEHLFIVCELLRDNLYEFYTANRESPGDELYFTLGKLQRITTQILTALKFIHSLGLLHCDLKPENILIKSFSRCEVKVIDFGSSCFTTDHLSSYVQSRSYRAPEVILGCTYGQKIDLWSLGCILAELCSGKVLFQNDSVPSLLARLIGIIGPISKEMLKKGRFVNKYFTSAHVLYEAKEDSSTIEYIYPKKSSLQKRVKSDDEDFLDFLTNLLKINPKERPTAEEALQHKWLKKSYPDSP